MKLTELRGHVRRQTETLEDELPNDTIDWYLRQAFDRTMAFENQWPFFEKLWTLTLPANKTTITLPGDVNPPGVLSLLDRTSGVQLEMLNFAQAEGWFGGVDPSATYPSYYSIWNGLLYLWPQMSFAESREFRLHGYRKASDWVAQGPEAEPDCDKRLHMPLIHYAIALAYAQQEDDELEDVYMQRWMQDVTRIAAAIMEPVHQKPLIQGRRRTTTIGGPAGGRGLPAYTIVPPGSS
jgi:hypothetical protein